MIDFNITSLDVVSSTMDAARDHLKTHPQSHGQVFIAKTQTKGRGRHERVWASEEGNLFGSLILQPRCDLNKASQLSVVMAIAIGEAILDILPKNAHLSYKWPNDILVNEKKICGILLEADTDNDHKLKSLIIGFGLNINSFPEDAIWPATSLREFGIELTPEVALQKVLEKVKLFYANWCEQGLLQMRTLWIERAYGLDKPIKVQAGGQDISGSFKDLSAEGALLLDHEGKLITVTSGEVYFKD